MTADLEATRGSTPAAPPPISYSFRSSIFVAERTYSIGSDSIDWRDERETGSLAFADVIRVRVYDIESSMFPTLRCVLSSRDARNVVLDATHYNAFNSTENRSESYLPFQRELVARIATANARTVFIEGHHWALWLFWLMIFIGSLLVFLGSLMVFFRGEMPYQAAGVIGLVALFLPVTWRNLRSGRPHHFDPRVDPRASLYSRDLRGNIPPTQSGG